MNQFTEYTFNSNLNVEIFSRVFFSVGTIKTEHNIAVKEPLFYYQNIEFILMQTIIEIIPVSRSFCVEAIDTGSIQKTQSLKPLHTCFKSINKYCIFHFW